MKIRWLILVFINGNYDCILGPITFSSEDEARQKIIECQEEDVREGWGKYSYYIESINIGED